MVPWRPPDKDSVLQSSRGGPVGGILVVDKPQGLTSNQVLRRLKRVSGQNKMGYQGTLDPLATGVLPVCLGWATKVIPFLPEGPKVYRAQMILGTTTDTQDVLGRVLSTSDRPPPDRSEVEEVCLSFIGVQLQTPPVYSALKFQGKPLYRWAREGRPVVKPPRTISIEAIRVLEAVGRSVRLEVTCSPGTYIRTLCADMGQRLGCGAVLNALVRLRSGPFRLDRARPLEILEEAAARGDLESLAMALDEALEGFPQVRLGEAWKKKIREGRGIPEAGVAGLWARVLPGESVCVKGEDDSLWAFYRVSDDGRRELQPLRVLI